MSPQPDLRRRLRTSAALAVALAAASSALAQDEITELSPFEVAVSKDEGYAARGTLAGSRLNTPLNDVPSQVSVMNSEFLQDIATTSVEDAFKYSIDVENGSDFTSSIAAGGDFTQGTLNYRTGDRIRGLGSPGKTHDFFATVIPGDTFNLDRISYAEGPNAILFGVGNPSGIVNSAFIQAILQRASGKFTYRTDELGTSRGTIDVNQPIVKDVLAIRLAAVKSDQRDWRKQAGTNDRRIFGAATYQPFKTTVIRGYFENVHLDDMIARNTRISDEISPWILAGEPAFNNGLTGTTPSPGANDPVFTRDTVTKKILVAGAPGGSAPFLTWGSAATAGTGSGAAYSGVTKGPGDVPYETGSNSYAYSLGKSYGWVSPLDVSVDGIHNLLQGTIKGGSLEQRIGDNLFLNLAFNEENDINPAVDFTRGQSSGIHADANLFLPDRVTPNPNYGRYYLETASPRITEFWDVRKEGRAMATYQFDFKRLGTSAGNWLGHWTFGGMYQATDSIQVEQDFVPRDVPANTPFATALANYGGAAYNTVEFRSYLSDPKKPTSGQTFYFNLPFDPLSQTPYTMPDGSTLYGLNNPFGGTNDPSISNNVVEGHVLTAQGDLIKDHLAITLGWRDDTTEQASLLLPQLGAGSAAYEPWYDAPTPKNWSVFTHGQSRTIGAVAHLLPWISVFYNRSGTFAPPANVFDPLTGADYAGSTGTGYDYGLTLNLLHDRVSVRINRYENSIGPAGSSFRNNIIPDVQNIELALQNGAAAGEIPAYQAAAHYDPNLRTFAYDVVSNQVARGYEFEVVGNITANWRVLFDGAKADSVQSGIGASWFTFISQRMPYWAANGGAYDPAVGATHTVLSYVSDLVPQLNLIQQSDGQEAEQDRSLRMNLVTRYAFDGGFPSRWLKGVFVGTGVAWRGKSVVGYRGESIVNPYFAYFPSLGRSLVVPSVNAPISGRPVTTVEGILGYERTVFKKLDWRIQLNVENLFRDSREIPQEANTSGAVAVFAIPMPTTYLLTSSISY